MVYKQNLRHIVIMGRYRRRRYYVNRDKYSVEQTALQTALSSSWNVVPADETALTQASRQFSIPVIRPTDIQGMRKVKHLTFTLSNAQVAEYTPFIYAIVYVPQGYQPQPINFPSNDSATALYPANQFVMASGVVDFSAGPCRIRIPLSRNLNSGDTIQLIFAVPSAYENVAITAHIKYAITLQ